MGSFKLVFDNFLDDFDQLYDHAINADYQGELNPYDGVMYPNISTNIPINIKCEIVNKLQGFLGVELKDIKMFMRLSLDGDNPPHSAHNDIKMGRYTFILYLNKVEHCHGGTSFVRHKDYPERETEHEIWARDTNKRDKWLVGDSVSMHPNKALLFNSELMHWAESPACYGDSAKNGRLILGCFFNL